MRRASPLTAISVSTTEISATGMKVFKYEHFNPVTGTKALLSQQGGQNGIILPCVHSTSNCIRIRFISKGTSVDKAIQVYVFIQVYVAPFWFVS